MWGSIITAVLLAAPAFASGYPKPSGFVNDFARRLTPQAVETLERKVRDYQSSSGNEVAVAIVQSLDGMLAEDYARGLFEAWGVGKQGLNNGVLFVWAPHERRIRIQVGRGLESALTDTQAGLILARVRDMFQRGEYEAGVTAAVDGIIETLTAAAGALPPPNERSRAEAAQREFEQQAAARQEQDEASKRRTALMLFGVGLCVVVGAYFIYRRQRAAALAKDWPRDLEQAERALDVAERQQAAAREALADLRKEAPEEVWQRFAGTMTDDLGSRRLSLNQLRGCPRGTYREKIEAHQGLAVWQDRISVAVGSFQDVTSTLEAVRGQRQEANQMLESIPPRLARMGGGAAPGNLAALLRAAADTFEQSVEQSRKEPANWLNIYALLSDVRACLDQLENPEARTQYRPVRFWRQDVFSPAADALQAIYDEQAAASIALDASSGGSDAGGFFGGGDSGGGGGAGGGDSGFGGGETGGGGASSDY